MKFVAEKINGNGKYTRVDFEADSVAEAMEIAPRLAHYRKTRNWDANRNLNRLFLCECVNAEHGRRIAVMGEMIHERGMYYIDFGWRDPETLKPI